MDHKVSKDMISSGMIPSGEKTQADLGRIQYGSAPSPSSLMDAYKSIYEHHKKDADGNTIPHEGEELTEMDRNMLGGIQAVSNLGPKLAVGAGGIGVGVKAGKMIHDTIKYARQKNKSNKTQTNSHELEGDQLDEINAGYSTDPGKATMSNAQVNTTTRQGKPRSKAQMMAARRIASGKSIADVKASNVQSMRSRAAERNAAFKAKRAGVSKPMSDTQGKNMPSNPQLKSQPKTSTSSNMSGSNRRALMSKRRRELMNDLDLFDLIKGAFIEEGYTESDALAFMVEASPEYLAELDRELTMLGAGLASIPAIAATAKKIFKPKVDKAIDKQRKTNKIGGDKRSGVGMGESAGVFADPKLNKKYPNQPKMTEKGKKILPNLPDPEGMGSRKTSKPAFGISKSTNDALKMIK